MGMLLCSTELTYLLPTLSSEVVKSVKFSRRPGTLANVSGETPERWFSIASGGRLASAARASSVGDASP